MTERSRTFLRQEFGDGERPSGNDFGDLIDSAINKVDDGVDVDGSSNLLLSGGLGLGNSNRNVPGTLRFNAGSVQVHDGTGFVDLASGGGGEGAFASVGSAGEVAYAGGNVGIGDFSGSPPTFRLQVELGANDSEANRVRFGNAAISNGAAALASDACFYHQNHSNVTGMALRQRLSGEVRLNAPTSQTLRLQQGGNQTRLMVASGGQVVIARASLLTGADFVLQVNGAAFKSAGGGQWNVASDARLKDEVRDLEAGLDKLRQVRPIRFRYNGKASTHAGEEGVGILGQEMEKVFPEMVTRVPVPLEEGGEEVDLRVYDGSALTYVLVNAVKELAARLEKLEAAIATKEASDELES